MSLLARRILERPQAAVAASLLAAALLLFREAIFEGRVFFYRDLHLLWHPQAEAFVRAVAAGSWPVWNPYVAFGQPLLANPNTQVLYPLTWLNLLMSPGTFFTWFAVFHFVTGGLGTYALARRLGVSTPGSVASAFLWVLSGPFLSLLNLWNHFAGAAWLPWCVWAGDRALERVRPLPALAWGALMALTVLVGSVESAVMAATATAALASTRARYWVLEPRRGAAAMGCAVLAFAVAVALSAGQWLPSLEIARQSARADLPARLRDFWSLAPLNLWQALLPVFPDRLPIHEALRTTLYESRETFLASLYLGAGSVALVAPGLLYGRGRRRVALGLLTGLCAALALGRHTPLYGAVVQAVPPLRSLRFPVKALILGSLGWALLGGLGYDAWARPRRSGLGWSLLWLPLALLSTGALLGWYVCAYRAEEWGAALLTRDLDQPSFTGLLAPTARALMWCAGCAAAGAVLVLARRWRDRAAPGLAAAVAAIACGDLALAHHALNPTGPPEVLMGAPAVLQVARPAPHQRLLVYDYYAPGRAARYLGHQRPYVTALPERDWPGAWFAALALRTYLFPSTLAVWGVEGSYGVDYLGLFSPDLATVNALVLAAEGSPLYLRYLQLAAVDRVVALHASGLEALKPLAIRQSLLLEPIHVFEVPDALPRTYAVGRSRIAPAGQGWRALQDPEFDPRREVILPAGPARDAGDLFRGWSRLVGFRADRVAIEADLNAPGYVVLVDSFDPGWRATLDGSSAPVLRANVAFRAVEAPAGRHHIELVYRPRSVIWGMLVSAATGVALCAVAVLSARSARPSSPAP